jgi:thiamine monophosphate synthase
MPTAITGQNGIEIHDTTKIGIAGCAKVKALTRAQKLTKALKACKKKAKGKRSGCEKTARKQFGPVKKAKKKK